MAQYIDKDAVVAELERLKSTYSDDENIHHVTRYNLLVAILFMFYSYRRVAKTNFSYDRLRSNISNINDMFDEIVI